MLPMQRQIKSRSAFTELSLALERGRQQGNHNAMSQCYKAEIQKVVWTPDSNRVVDTSEDPEEVRFRRQWWVGRGKVF